MSTQTKKRVYLHKTIYRVLMTLDGRPAGFATDTYNDILEGQDKKELHKFMHKHYYKDCSYMITKYTLTSTELFDNDKGISY